MRATLLLILAVISVEPCGRLEAQSNWLTEAMSLGRTRDDALFESFNKSYSLSASGTIDQAEVVTEFRRAVLIVRERARHADYAFGADDLASALVPYRGLVTFIVQVRLNPLNVFIKEPAYHLYIRTGPTSPPIAPAMMKRDAMYPPGGQPGGPAVAVRLEGSFPRAAIEGAPSPMLIVTDEKAEVLWQARIDLSRYR